MYHVPWLFNVYMDAVMKEAKMEMGREGVRFQEDGREWGLPGLLHADDLVLCGESEENLRAMVERFAEVYKRRSLKVNIGKSKVMVLGGEEGLECEVCEDGIRLEHVLVFKYLKCVLDESGTDEAECRRRVAGDIMSLVNARSLQVECAMVLYESLLVPVLTYVSETMIGREKERSKIRAVQMDNLRGLLGIRKMDKVPNVRKK